MNPKRIVLLFMICSIIFFSCGNNEGIEVSKLLCEYRENPINLNMAQPRFSWILQSEQRGQKQNAYQILVSSSKEK